MLQTKSVAFGVLTSLLLAGAAAAQEDRCRIALEKAAYDEVQVQTNQQFERTVITSLAQQDFRRLRQQVAGGADVEIGPFSIGAEYELDRFEEMQRYYQSSGDTRLRTSDRSFVVTRVASKTAYENWLKCIALETSSATPQPVKLAVLAAAEDSVLLSMRWDRNVTTRQPRVLGVDGEQLRCQPVPAQRLSSEAVSFTCAWATPFAERGVVIVRTQRSGSPAAVIPRPKRQLAVDVDFKRPQEQFSNARNVCTATAWAPENHEDAEDGDGLHEVECGDGGNACNGRWALQTVRMELRPNAGYRLAGEPRFECDENRGSCGWNAVGDPRTWHLIANTRDVIRAERAVGSRRIGIRLCAVEGVVTSIEVDAANHQTFTVLEGQPFTVEVPAGARAVVRVAWPDGASDAVDGLPRTSTSITCTGNSSGTGIFSCIANRPRRPASSN